MLQALWGRVRKLETAEDKREGAARAALERERLERGDVHTATVPDKYKRFFAKMVSDGASDLFVSAGSRAALRVDGRVKFVTGDNASGDFVRAMFEALVGLPYETAFAEHKELDFAFEIPNIGRFRANLFHQKGEVGGVFRHIKDKVPSFEELNLPSKQLMRLAKLKRGLVLVTGIAGSGKSTTLAGMIEFINETMSRHIITVEDPIEFVYREKLAIIDQREVGLDTHTFARALKSAVRQSPDVILVGEMRDKDTMQAAIQAAETGHLVCSTLHTVNAQQTVERIITYFPPHQHDLLRLQLSMVLAGVISQRLLPKRDAGGRVPAVEVMLSTPTIKDLIYEGRTRELYAAIAEDTYFGNMTFNESLRKLYEAGVISLEEAMAAADNPDELKLEIRGISRGTKASDLDFQF
jgi:twitching motility protein PilT